MVYITPNFLRETWHKKITKKGRYLRGGGYKKQTRVKSKKVKIFKKDKFI